MSPALCFRILSHLEGLGLLNKGDTILDFLGGIGTTCLAAGTLGYRSIMVELEEKFIDLARQNKAHVERRLGRPLDMTIIQGDARQLSQLLQERGLIALTSPPYGEAMDNKGKRHGNSGICGRDPKMVKMRYDEEGNPANIGNLPDRVESHLVSVVSPPYEDSSSQGASNGIDSPEWRAKRKSAGRVKLQPYEAEGQIGQECNESYMDAVRQVYTEASKVADVLVVVVKDPTRNKKLHPLGELTAQLLEQCGWRIVDYHFALLFEEQEQGHLFEKSKKKVRGRLSFFKRLSWQKGSPVADGEHILICQR